MCQEEEPISPLSTKEELHNSGDSGFQVEICAVSHFVFS